MMENSKQKFQFKKHKLYVSVVETIQTFYPPHFSRLVQRNINKLKYIYIVLKQQLSICETLCRDFNFYFTLLFVLKSRQTKGKAHWKSYLFKVLWNSTFFLLQPLNIEVLKFLNDKCNTII